MKKIISILFVAVLCLSIFSGCGESKAEQEAKLKEEIKEELRGEWSYDYYAVYVDEHCTKTYNFKGNGHVESSWVNIESPSKSSYHEGTYEIKDKTIEIKYNDGSEGDRIEFSYNNGNLKLFDNGDQELKKN